MISKSNMIVHRKNFIKKSLNQIRPEEDSSSQSETHENNSYRSYLSLTLHLQIVFNFSAFTFPTCAPKHISTALWSTGRDCNKCYIPSTDDDRHKSAPLHDDKGDGRVTF